MAPSARQGPAALDIKGLNVFYGASHALQGVDLRLESGVLSVVGRNGMGKTTLCKAILGLVPAAGGSVSFAGQSLLGKDPTEISRMGIGYVPQGRRLWPSLSVDEHLKMVAKKGGAWSVERVYSTFPRLAERKSNGGAQLSGGEQQMLAISRALLANPRLLVMDEPTEGLAPVIVDQVEEMLIRLAEEGDMEVLVIEQNIGVACAVADQVAIMVNGQIARMAPAAELAGDRDLQQRLLGVGRHAHDDTPEPAGGMKAIASSDGQEQVTPSSTKIYNANPTIPNRWSQPVPVAQLERMARVQTASLASASSSVSQIEIRPLTSPGESVVLVAGTLDTKGDELRYMRDIVRAAGIPVRMVDLSTSGAHSGAEVPAHQIAAFHPRGASGVFTGDRGTSVAGMVLAFERWIERQSGIAGIISAGGSGGTAMVSPAMRALPVGVPKLIVSTVASGQVSQYIGPSDITMMHSVADVQGLNVLTEDVLGNAAHAMVGMVKARREVAAKKATKPAIGLTMFGVTTPAIQQVVQRLEDEVDCLVFHATGIGGQSMEKLIDSRTVSGVIDLTTTEICDMLVGGVFPATDDRFGAVIRTRMPYIGSVGATDMVNFGAPETVPDKFKGRLFYEHNPQVTLMRTTPDECADIGRWIGMRLNEMEGPVRFFLTEGGVSALDAPGQAFYDLAANKALFDALQSTVRQTANRRLMAVPHHINDPAMADLVATTFRELHGSRTTRTKRASR
ncbi:MAG: ABC transporter permease [Pseudomonadota bacterium]